MEELFFSLGLFASVSADLFVVLSKLSWLQSLFLLMNTKKYNFIHRIRIFKFYVTNPFVHFLITILLDDLLHVRDCSELLKILPKFFIRNVQPQPSSFGCLTSRGSEENLLTFR